MSSSPFLQSVADFMRARNYSRRTIRSYCHWIKRFVLYYGKRHPEKLGASEVERFLSWLAVERNVAPGTQALALNASVFLYRTFLGRALAIDSGFARARRPRKLPLVLTRQEVGSLLSTLSGVPYLMAGLLYGSGLRRIELARLRVKDVDLDYKQLRVIFGKGGKHRVVTLAEELVPHLRRQVERVSLLLAEDQTRPACAGVWMPQALARKYPKARTSPAWQYLIPSSRARGGYSQGANLSHPAPFLCHASAAVGR